ncbi:glycosyltransferase family 2 protein [Robbsia andropogonis]|uniref:glycosyltransferase family 2 protein n=1 Tax=Robbsia andropogonis TaxID=28092 RepID=UPI002A6ACD3B|nr:glycosyltransferase family 2 protein [Robbsia andropogonis]
MRSVFASIPALLRLPARIVLTIRHQAIVRGGLFRAFSYYGTLLQREGLGGITRRLTKLRKGQGVADSPPADDVYRRWIARFDTIDDVKRQTLRAAIAALPSTPLISVVMPTFNSDVALLRETIASVQAQLYSHWELCIADDASTDPAVVSLLEEMQAADARIRFVVRERNGHIAEASNSALALARGEYVALLDHDDLLPEHALYMVAHYINRFPQGRLFYSDEDKLTTEGGRTTPYFKPDWNPQLSLSQNLFSHLGVFETSLVRSVGGFRPEFIGSQDYDLMLRCVDVAGYDAVVHIPHILYHWRLGSGSTAQNVEAKPYAHEARLNALREHLARNAMRATVLTNEASGQPRVRYALPEPVPLVSIIIPTRDGLALLRQCIQSLFEKTTYPYFEILIVDNGSVEQETLSYLASIDGQRGVRVLRDDAPFNFSALNNQAAAAAHGDYLCLLNNDIEVISPDWLDEMVGLAALPDSGAVGARLWYPNDTLQHGGVLLGVGGVAGHLHAGLRRWQLGYFLRAASTQNLSAVTGACLVIRASTYHAVGGLDEDLPVAFNDIDFCIRLGEAGYRNIWTPFAELYHHESATRGSDMNVEKYRRFVEEVRWMERRWPDHLARDPAYNPNLTVEAGIPPFTLAHSPRIGQFD